MPEPKARVLAVDDEPTQLKLLSATIARAGYAVETLADGKAALARLAKASAPPIDCLILDLEMPGLTGIETLKALRPQHPDLPVIVLTVHSGVDHVVEAMKAGASDFIVKPASAERLRSAIESALADLAMTGELAPMQRAMGETTGFHDLVGTSPAMSRALELARKAAATSIPVLIEGESGVGKELFARAIHEASARAGGPFVPVNCGAIPENLVESSLFGHEKGAFTGADQRHTGKFQEASGGTLFLDEVSELSQDIQIKLLRALQEGEVDPIGAREPVPVDIRLISATNQDMARRVAEGRVREDLYYRLNVFPLRVPPLRERPEDIPALARHFVDAVSRAENLPAKTLSQNALDLLTGYDWPGNIRQLQNAVFRAVVMCEGEDLTQADFPQIRRQAPGQRQAESAGARTAGPEPGEEAPTAVPIRDAEGHIRPLDAVEAEVIEHAVELYGGRLSEAARRLGIGRSTLYRRLQTLGLDARARRIRR